jgi:hypothetical protein
MHRQQAILTVIAALALVATLAGCGGSGGPGAGGPPGTGSPGTPLVAGNFTATPAGGESLKDMALANGGPETMAFVIWGGQIEDLRLGMMGTTFGQIIYSTGSSSNHDLAIVDVVTGATRTIVDSPYDEIEPTWIEDGNRIAYEMAIGGDTDVYTALPDGRGRRSLTHQGMPPYNYEGPPAGVYSNDELLYVSDSDGDTEIYKASTDGGGTLLTTNSDWDRHPAWSPTTSRIVYSSHVGGDWDLRIMRQDGSANYAITSDTTPEDEPAWSPDGTRIAYTKRVSGNWDIYVCNVDGSGEQRLTSNGAEDLHPSWSPDGTQIVFESKRAGNGDIYVMNANGTGETRIVSGTAEDMDPEWNPAAEFARTFVGPAGSDGGEDPPFGSTPLDLALISGDDAGVLFFGMRCLGAASAVQVKNLNEEMLYPALLGISIHTPDTITLLGQDQGRGKDIVRHIRNTGTEATFVGDFDNVMIVFEPEHGRVMALAPWRGAPNAMLPLDVDSLAAAQPTLDVAGGQIIIRGPALGAPGGGICQELVFDATTGEIVSYG